jgi:integrase/recombinase XerD
VGYLRGMKGLETKSCEELLLGARRFLGSFRDHLPGQDLETLNGQHVLSLVQHQLSLSMNQATGTAVFPADSFEQLERTLITFTEV